MPLATVRWAKIRSVVRRLVKSRNDWVITQERVERNEPTGSRRTDNKVTKISTNIGG